jgi:KaiC/GvpD/RAD55 family RecA-like ATPase
MKRGRSMPLQAPGKAPAGIVGLNDLTAQRVPAGRTTLPFGGTACGKKLFALHPFKANRE